ncbi:hypothetical protein ElyMa_004060700 [Elysia marginata]|uniref:Reverse transcriptase zinc-binding domain-containing protein n=1 Tax=Elysia marginata TaxID=1093978 RepID=A0AAV4G7Y8_9GAST|nr:hypothetical protein ElyMa_004060700 [Elysia marginata]
MTYRPYTTVDTRSLQHYRQRKSRHTRNKGLHCPATEYNNILSHCTTDHTEQLHGGMAKWMGHRQNGQIAIYLHGNTKSQDSINSLERRDQVTIFRLRTQHDPVNAHRNRIQPMITPVCHFCDAPYKTTTHLLFQCTLITARP